MRTEHTFNGRDQVIQTVQTDLGPTPTPTATPTPTPSTVQTTTATFDGHGRLASTHRPEQRDGSTLKYTTYSYNQDDSIQTVTDARGAVTTYTYENVSGVPKRPLVTGISWTVPGGSGITVPGTVTFDYDNVGNRKWMDRYNVSKTTYAYDSLSRITSETVEFDDLEDRYTIEYAYHIGGSVKSVTDPFSAVVTYDGDKAGRTTAVNGSGFASGIDYASGITYRAFGGLKQMTYGSSDGSVVSYTYDAALRPLTYQATSSVLGGGFVRKAAYEYNKDGSPKFVDDQKDGRFDQTYGYDHMGRLKGTTSGLVTNSENEEVPA